MMDEHDEWQPSPPEAVVTEGMRRAVRDADDHQLDRLIATTIASRDVAAAHAFPATAAMLNRTAMAYDDERRERHATRREFAHIVNPVQVVRPMTADELDELEG